MVRQLLTVKQVAEELVKGQHSVLTLIHNGSLVASDISSTPGIGRPNWRVDSVDLELFLQRRQHRTTPRKRKKKQKNYREFF